MAPKYDCVKIVDRKLSKGNKCFKIFELKSAYTTAEMLQLPIEYIVREEIQKIVLQHLFLQNFFVEGVLHGGVAFRLVYYNPRYPEELNFVFTQKNAC